MLPIQNQDQCTAEQEWNSEMPSLKSFTDKTDSMLSILVNFSASYAGDLIEKKKKRNGRQDPRYLRN